jgi:dCTP deaminase
MPRGRPPKIEQVNLDLPQNPKDDYLSTLFEKALKNYVETHVPEPTLKEPNLPDPYSFIGTLPDWALKQHIKDGIIKIDPLPEDWEEKVDEVTIDLHLGNVLKVFTLEGLNTIDTRYTTKEEMEAMMRTVYLKPGQPFILTENDFVVAATKERLTIPDNIIGHLHGKSSLARLGIVVHSTAARFDPGWDGHPALEFGTFLRGKKTIIYEGSTICAFSFEKMAHNVTRPYKENPNAWVGKINPDASQIAVYNIKNGEKKAT